MKRIHCFSLGLLVLVMTSSAHAQGPYTRPLTNSTPPVSPYLNLTRGGNSAVNYYGLVRPQMDAQRLLQQTQTGGGMPAGSGLTMDMPNSGHPVQFMNFSHYFNNNVGAGLSGRGAGQGNGPASLRR